MKIELRDGLLFTSISLAFRGSTSIIDDVVIDTGAAETLLSPDAVEKIGLVAEMGDKISSFYRVGGSFHNSFSKHVDKIVLGAVGLEDVKVNFGVIDPSGRINGLLGLDLLMEIGAIIDLKNLIISV